MRRPLFQISFFFFLFILTRSVPLFAQYKIRGTVYDSTRTYPVELVSVLSTSGKGTITDSKGEYEIEVGEKDSIWFSYLNKPTVKFPVLKIITPFNFDIALRVNVPVLNEIRIKQRNYKQDSIQNREDYAKAFNFRKPGLSVVTPQYGQAAGFSLEEIISIFQFRKNRSMKSFQTRLITQEQDKFIDHRFNKGLVRRLTSLSESALDSFMVTYRPSYRFTVITGDYDFQKYIKDAAERFKKGLPPEPIWIEEETDQ